MARLINLDHQNTPYNNTPQLFVMYNPPQGIMPMWIKHILIYSLLTILMTITKSHVPTNLGLMSLHDHVVLRRWMTRLISPCNHNTPCNNTPQLHVIYDPPQGTMPMRIKHIFNYSLLPMFLILTNWLVPTNLDLVLLQDHVVLRRVYVTWEYKDII